MSYRTEGYSRYLDGLTAPRWSGLGVGDAVVVRSDAGHFVRTDGKKRAERAARALLAHGLAKVAEVLLPRGYGRSRVVRYRLVGTRIAKDRT